MLANGDSIRCSALTYEVNMNGRISDLTYKDKKGKKVEIHDKKEIPEISSMTLSGKTFDLLPVNLKKPDEFVYSFAPQKNPQVSAALPGDLGTGSSGSSGADDAGSSNPRKWWNYFFNSGL